MIDDDQRRVKLANLHARMGLAWRKHVAMEAEEELQINQAKVSWGKKKLKFARAALKAKAKEHVAAKRGTNG